MAAGMFFRAAIISIAAACAAFGQATPTGQARPASRPATASAPSTAPARRAWGAARAGLSVSASAFGPWTVGRPMKIDFAIRNTGSVPASLGKKNTFFGYCLLVQGQRFWFTEKIPLPKQTAFPSHLRQGQVLRLPAVDLAKLTAYSGKRGMKIIDGWPMEVVAGKPRAFVPAGTVAEVLQPGPVKIAYVAYLSRGAEGNVSLRSAGVPMALGLGDFARLSAADQRRVLDALGERFYRDAWSAKTAHDDAVGIGAPAVGVCVKVLKDARAKPFAKAWAVTALADVGTADVVGVLIACLTDPTPGVRHAAAYHGMKVRHKKFIDAALARARGGKDPLVTAWTIMGCLRFRKAVPDDLLAAALDSPEWKVRAAVAETVARGNPNRSHLPILRRLICDAHGPIRVTAARALRGVGDASFETLDALVAALAMDGDHARRAVAEALCALTGRKSPYPAAGSDADKAAAIKAWQVWWDKAGKTYGRKDKGK